MQIERLPEPVQTLPWRTMSDDCRFQDGEQLLVARRTEGDEGGWRYDVETLAVEECEGVAYADSIGGSLRDTFLGGYAGYVRLRPGTGEALRPEPAEEMDNEPLTLGEFV